LHKFIHEQEDSAMTQMILNRSMFGSDFTVNLAKVESYTNYLRIFEESPFSDEEVHGFVSTNPIRFLGLELEE
ncbi:MAG: amidohydrolase, partial [Sphaerochaetaceae bacterium]|nr:amidohydrolase [Sphaerochaetaceae bacterium]